MDTSKRRFIRLAIVTATAAGVALASPVVAVADESEVIEAAPIGENSDPPVVTIPTTEPLVIELIVEGDPLIDSTESPDELESEEPASAEAMPTVTDSQPVGADTNPMMSALQTSSADEHAGGPGEDHIGGTGRRTTSAEPAKTTPADPAKTTPEAAEPEIPTGSPSRSRGGFRTIRSSRPSAADRLANDLRSRGSERNGRRQADLGALHLPAGEH